MKSVSIQILYLWILDDKWIANFSALCFGKPKNYIRRVFWLNIVLMSGLSLRVGFKRNQNVVLKVYLLYITNTRYSRFGSGQSSKAAYNSSKIQKNVLNLFFGCNFSFNTTITFYILHFSMLSAFILLFQQLGLSNLRK